MKYEKGPLTRVPARVSYVVLCGALLAAGWLHLAALLLAALFSFFALEKLLFKGKKWLAILLFFVLIVGMAYGVGYFVKVMIVALPKMADETIPTVISWAETKGIELPFTDFDTLKSAAMEGLKEQAHALREFAHGASTFLVSSIIGVVVAISLFLNAELDLDPASHRIRNNLYSICCQQIGARFRSLYESFATVMGAQIVISAINTALTAVFALVVHLPYAVVIIGLTFFAGLLPIVGNLISNTVMVCLALTVSPKLALGALIFLVVVHKLEYFLNSKIIGDRIRTPIWLTLIGIIVGERLMGIAGMILAPVILNYIRIEASKVEVTAKEKE